MITTEKSSSLGGSVATPRLSKESWIAIASLLGIVVHLLLRFLLHAPERTSAWPLIAVLLAGAPLLFDLLKKLAAFDVGSDALAGISIVTSAILGMRAPS